MNSESLKKSISDYKEQLRQINIALLSSEGDDKNDLISLKSDVEQLIELTEENLSHLSNNEQPSTSQTNNTIDDEYLLFLQEMEAEGVESNAKKKLEKEHQKELEEDLKTLEGMKCQAPHTHSWGHTTYHNALVCAVIKTENKSFNEIKVRVMFTNPTHREMLPCPYFLEDSNCKFSDEQCRFSHGEIVTFSSLKEYIEPNYENLKVGSIVLAKSKDNLWNRAVVLKIGRNNCNVKYEANKKEDSVDIKDVLPLEDSEENYENSDSSNSDGSEENNDTDWIIQRSLLNLPPSQILGEWEKHTKGIGSKLMQQMGYVVGTGLGRNAEGRIDPVQAVVLPSGKSLDHCMNLRELAGGDEDLFSAERKLKKQQKRQEALSKKIYEKEKNKKDIFEFLNNTLTLSKTLDTKTEKIRKDEIKSGSNRDLNVKSLKLEEEIKRLEVDICKMKENLTRLKSETVIYKNYKLQVINKEEELSKLKAHVRSVQNEQNLRKDKKKMTVF